MTSMDMKVICKVLDGMSIQQRREWFVKIRMSQRGLTYDQIATDNGLSLWGLGGAVSGRFGWGPKVLTALEKSLNEDLTMFLTDRELARCRRAA